MVAGVEIESYTISLPEYDITRELAFPRKGVGERGEHFRRDWSIGTEYNSRPFKTIREGLFLVKAGLRKYSHHHYRSKNDSQRGKQLLLVGGWRDRFAGAHIHLSIAGQTLDKADARHLAGHIHDHIPFLIAMGANSPVWAEELTNLASNRIVKASKIYFKPIRRGELTMRSMDEMLFNRSRVTKPPTLEVRVLDANVPEYLLAAVCVVKAVALAWLAGKKSEQRIPHAAYLRARNAAAERGMKAVLDWNGSPIPATKYLDRFLWTYREELDMMDIPHELWSVFKLLKRGWNGSALLHAAARAAYNEHPQTWQRRFAKRYVKALDALLAGNSILDFTRHLDVETPDLDSVWLGRRNLKFV